MKTAMGLKPKKSWMTPKRFRQIIERLGITQRELAARLDYSANSITSYATGEGPIPRVLATLMEAVDSGTAKLPPPVKKSK